MRREGGTVATAGADLRQGDETRITALATYGDLDRLGDDVRTTAAEPDLPPVEECVPNTMAPPEVRAMAPLMDRFDMRFHPDHIGWAVGQPSGGGELAAWFLVDLSASVDFGSDLRAKRGVAREFVGVLSRLLTRHGNRVGALLYGTSVDTVIPARAGRLHVLHLLQRMAQRPAESAAGATQLRDLLLAGQRIVKRRSTIFVVSDFISPPGWEEALAQLSRRHDVTAVRLYDPLEMELPDLGLVTMRDAETGEQLLVDTHDAGFRARFAAAAQARESALLSSLAQAGVDTLELATDDDLLDAILRFADLRRQRSRMAAGGGAPSHLGVLKTEPRRAAS